MLARSACHQPNLMALSPWAHLNRSITPASDKQRVLAHTVSIWQLVRVPVHTLGVYLNDDQHSPWASCPNDLKTGRTDLV